MTFSFGTYCKRIEAGRSQMRQFSAGGVPALISGAGDNRRITRANAFFGNIESLAAGLKAA